MNTPYVGIGKNPEGKDLPLGFGMQLAQVPGAMDTFGSLSQPQRDAIVEYIQGCTSGRDAKERIANVVNGLSEGRTNFFKR
ncbi:MAG: hypothetical protein FWE80_09785 [Oscillospiraceae bacterium]|nr:hypothetical protein [Oscillospiraceae bacterium]